MKFKISYFPSAAVAALLAAAICVAAALPLLWPLEPLTVIGSPMIMLPVWGSTAVLMLLCIAALYALEYNLRLLAALLAGVVAILVAVTIACWVMNLPPPFNVTLFGDSGNEPLWFPSNAARDAAIVLALGSAAIVLLASNTGHSVVRPLGWATGFVLTLAPIAHLFVSLVATTSPHTPANLIAWILVWSAVAFLGLGLLASHHTRVVYTVDWGARVRATIVVLVVAITLAFWHSIRTAEIRQLQSELSSALLATETEFRKGLSDHAMSADRLLSHWRNLDWRVSDRVFLADAHAYIRDYPAVAVIMMTDAEGRLVHAARHESIFSATSAQDHDDKVTLADANSIGQTIVEGPGGVAEIVRRAMTLGQRMRGTPVQLQNGIRLYSAAQPVTNDGQQKFGAFVLLYRRDLSMQQILQDTAVDFHLRVSINNELAYDRPASGGVAADEAQYLLVARQRFNNSDYTYEIAPGPKVIARNLTWTPALVLIFAWSALILLTFALYNERRAYALARDRERILNESLDLICTLDAQGRYVTVNDTSQHVLGYAREEIVGRHFSDLIHPGDKDLLAKQWQDARAGIRPSGVPLRFVHKNGATVYLQGNAHWSAQEQLFYCDMRDVSDQHALELARVHAANTFNTGVEQAGCVVYEYLYDTQQIAWVGAIHALTGYDPDEFAKPGFEGWMQAIHPDDRAHVRNTLQRCLESRQPHTIDYRLRRKDGAYVPVLDRGQHVEDAAQTQPRMIGALIDLTAIRQQEIALRHSEERYRIIATQVGSVVIERDTATGRVRVFGPVEQIYGYTKEQIESRPYGPDDTMIHSEDRARVAAVVANAEQTLSNYYVEYRRRHRGGHYIHIASRGVVLAGVDGRAERAVIAVTDITERKLAEERLQENEERFRAAAEQARQIVYEFAYNERLQIVSKRFAGAIGPLLGYAGEEFNALHAESHLALFHADDIDIARNLPVAVINEMGSFQVEHRLRHKNGSYVYVENRAAARRDAEGNLIAIVGMMIDISTRKAAENERQAYTAQLGQLADIARKVSTLFSLHELLNYLARSMRELIGANAAAAIVRDSSLTIDGIAAVSYAEHYGVQRGEPAPFGSAELHSLFADGNKPMRLTSAQTGSDPRWMQLTQGDDLQHPLRGWLAAPLTTRDGENLGLLQMTDKSNGDFTDSDAQVLSQLAGVASVAIENIRLYATLEERVAVRTRELQMSNRELEAFSYSVSHDLRAPLRAIAGFSSILEQEYASKLDTAARRYLQRIGSGVERMASLIDDLLSLARVSRLDIKRESIDLTSLCRTIVKRQTERWPNRDLQIKIDPRMRVNADPRLVEVALENLVENAIKFTGLREQSQIHIGKRAANGKPAFFVHDNGVGFDPQYAANLFGVFQRLHSASEFPGTGVGLATVQRIMQRHHGRVWAESQIGQGAVFYFTFDSEA